ncbi:MAG: Spy/CpxP family protein refolding chaperone [Myxococcales bacterium]|nr:Spy/CpxP family protein refolding chaperone [Myxococcales bacterium]
MSKWMLLGLSLAVMGATGCGGGARAERMEKMVQWRVDDALDELDATQAQRERIQAITKDAIAKAKPIAEQGQAASAVLVTQWKSSAPDSSAVHQLVDAQLDTVRAFAHVLVDKALEVHQLLTPKQRDQISSRLERFEKRTTR